MKDNITGFGLDFGTSNTLIAYQKEDETQSYTCNLEQLVDDNILESRKSFPSFAYIDENSNIICGEIARKKSSYAPERSVSSVKSWLCNHLVNRTDEILPWEVDEHRNADSSPIKRYTPVKIASEIIRQALNASKESLEKNELKSRYQDMPLVVTIPASFDEVARELTRKACQDAGIQNLIFLEEPLAALYAWLADNKNSWRDHLLVGDIILVCDIGGGTTDFTLVGVQEANGELQLERFSVGDHILLGGDNIDLALSYLLAEKAEAEGAPLDSWQRQASIHLLRELKEKVLQDNPSTVNQPNSVNGEVFHLAIPSRGRNLFSGGRSFALSPSFFLDSILEGFFPTLDHSERKTQESFGISATGLPFETDPRFTVHLLDFLKQSFRSVIQSEHLKEIINDKHLNHERGLLKPTKLLFNGGVFNSKALQDRITLQMTSLFGDEAPTCLVSSHYEESVARGAAYFSSLKNMGENIPIHAGLSQSLYLGVRENTLAVPGIKPKLKGICVMPKGTKEGSEFALTSTKLTLRKGQKNEFPLFASKERGNDTIGEVILDADKNLTRIHSISTEVPSDNNDTSPLVPVTLRVKSTEIGTLEIWMDESLSERSHQVEFKIRE